MGVGKDQRWNWGFLLWEDLLFTSVWALGEGQVCLAGVWQCLCHLTQDEEIQQCGLAGRVFAEAHAAGVRAVVIHGHSSDGDADVPTVNIATELDAMIVALPVLHQPVEIARHSIHLARGGDTISLVFSVGVCRVTP